LRFLLPGELTALPNPLARLSRPLGGEGKAMRKGEERRGRKKGKGMGRKRSGLSPSKKNS